MHNDDIAIMFKGKSQAREIWRRMCKNKGAILGLIILVVFSLCAILAPLFFDYADATGQHASIRLQPPSAQHWFGTDDYGRDVFARVIFGARISLTIGFVTAGLSLFVSGILGAAAGYYGGRVEGVIMRFMDILTSIPAILLALSIVSVLGPSMTNLLIAITISSIPGFTRLVRASILTVVNVDYVEAARACGASDAKIIVQHIIPNAIGPIIVNTTLSIADMIMQAAGLSFIGMGVQPPTPEWGSMLSGAREYMRSAPYLMVFPGFAIILSALSFNLLGDGLRDALDPKLKNFM